MKARHIFGTGTTVTAAPASEPVTLTEAKNWIKVSSGVTADDDLVTGLIQAAREQVEQYTNLKLFTQTVKEVYDHFPHFDENYNPYAALMLTWSPVQSITSVVYIAEDGSSTTLNSSEYITDLVTKPARITPTFEDTWPLERNRMKSVEITYVAGYSDTADIPETVKTAMKLMITYLYDNRTDAALTLPMASRYLLNPYRVQSF